MKKRKERREKEIFERREKLLKKFEKKIVVHVTSERKKEVSRDG